jgi:hypothetical protein
MSREKIQLRVIKGALVPANQGEVAKMRDRGYNLGDLLIADLHKPRNPKFNRLVHNIGAMVVANIDDYQNMTAHEAIKQIQLMAGIACDKKIIEIPNTGKCVVSVPKSLAFDSMDEGEFLQVAKLLCRYIATRYWTTMSPEQVQEMAEAFVE